MGPISITTSIKVKSWCLPPWLMTPTIRADSRCSPSQWETVLLCNQVSHWLGRSLESALHHALLVMCCSIVSENIFSLSIVLNIELKIRICVANMIVILYTLTWWRHQMDTFSTLLAICAGNSPVSGEFPAQRPVMRSFEVFFDLRLNKRLSKQ